MSLVEIVTTLVEKDMDKVATRIQYELKRECPQRTGEAAGAIHIEDTGQFSKRIGGTNSHLYWADQGNGPGSIPRDGSRKVMPVSGSRGEWIAFRTGPFNSYEGKHFVKAVADRHR